MNKFETVVKVIDDKFGEGYAQEHPELVGSTMIADSIYSVTEIISDMLENVGSLSSIVSLFRSKS